MANNQLTDGIIDAWFNAAKAAIHHPATTRNEHSHAFAAYTLAQEVKKLRAELKERRKAAEPELKPANLINKFYERYPVASFKSDTERGAALGYFMAGAELQCFGEFVKYEDLCGDE